MSKPSKAQREYLQGLLEGRGNVSKTQRVSANCHNVGWTAWAADFSGMVVTEEGRKALGV